MNELQKHPHSTQTICVSQSQLCSVFIHFHGQCLLEQYWHSRGHFAGTACTYVVTVLSPSFNTSDRNFLVNFSTLKHFGPVYLSKDLCFFAQICLKWWKGYEFNWWVPLALSRKHPDQKSVLWKSAKTFFSWRRRKNVSQMYSEYVSEFRTCVWIDEHPWHLSWRRGLQGRSHHFAQWRRKWNKVIGFDFSVFSNIHSNNPFAVIKWSDAKLASPIKVKCDTFDPVSVHLTHLIQNKCIWSIWSSISASVQGGACVRMWPPRLEAAASDSSSRR